MGLANLANVPRSPEEVSVFAFSNQDEHFKAAAALGRTKGLNLPLYPVDPIPFADIGVWAQNHQQMHNAVNAALGTAGADLTGVNFQDEAQLAAWISLHFAEHQAWQQILGMT